MKEAFKEIGMIPFSPVMEKEWKKGNLHPQWADRYPELFDEDDIRLAENQSKTGHHFVEWLSAIALFSATGYLSLISKYEFDSHSRKAKVVTRLFPDGLPGSGIDQINDRNAQYPDLLTNSPDYSNWFFCEVKGPGDTLSKEQNTFFKKLAAVTNKSIRILRLREL